MIFSWCGGCSHPVRSNGLGMIINVRGKCYESSTIITASAERRLEQAFNQDPCLFTSHVCDKKETFCPLQVRNGMSCAKRKKCRREDREDEEEQEIEKREK